MKKKVYVDNAKLYNVLCEYFEKCKVNVELGKQKPRVPEYVGECMLLIAERLSYKFQFKNYQYREDMISDGYINCLLYMNNFDPQKSQNPFSYFTQIIYFAFLRKIQSEKKHLYIKYKLQENTGFTGSNFSDPNGNLLDYSKNNMDMKKISDFTKEFETYMKNR